MYASNSHPCSPRAEFAVHNRQALLLQPSRICMITHTHTHHATDTPFGRAILPGKTHFDRPRVGGYSQFRSHAESKFLHYLGSYSTGSSRPSHCPFCHASQAYWLTGANPCPAPRAADKPLQSHHWHFRAQSSYHWAT